MWYRILLVLANVAFATALLGVTLGCVIALGLFLLIHRTRALLLGALRRQQGRQLIALALGIPALALGASRSPGAPQGIIPYAVFMLLVFGGALVLSFVFSAWMRHTYPEQWALYRAGDEDVDARKIIEARGTAFGLFWAVVFVFVVAWFLS